MLRPDPRDQTRSTVSGADRRRYGVPSDTGHSASSIRNGCSVRRRHGGNRRAGVWRHQGGARLDGFLAARTRKGGRRVEPGGRCPTTASACTSSRWRRRHHGVPDPTSGCEWANTTPPVPEFDVPAIVANPSSPSHPTLIAPPADDSQIVHNENPTPKPVTDTRSTFDAQ